MPGENSEEVVANDLMDRDRLPHHLPYSQNQRDVFKHRDRVYLKLRTQ
jgi:hypothetical protein